MREEITADDFGLSEFEPHYIEKARKIAAEHQLNQLNSLYNYYVYTTTNSTTTNWTSATGTLYYTIG